MNNLNYPREQLLEKVQENRAKHEQEYTAACVEYRNLLQTEFQNKLALLADGKTVEPHSKLVKPVEYLKDYDRAIMMLKMTSDEQVELDQDGFAQLIMDEWHWKNQFNVTNSMYGVNR